MSDNILVARGLSKTYTLGRQRLEVLREINLQVRRGEALVIVGASGAGKTTLLHLLGGLDSPACGEVNLNGVSVFGLSGTARARMRNEQVGFVFQSYNLLPELDALENVCLPALLARRSLGEGGLKRGMELLRAVGLGERLEHRPAELSGGEQQRVAVARALMNRPALLLADEPTGNLDSKTGEAILELLWRLRAEMGATLVMVTHDTHLSRRGDRVMEIADGRILG
jgi:predicted ABC-type transport system involved in lysophospholipase L1 biosynthesis ATPase subunit